jgi:hypothetical protein
MEAIVDRLERRPGRSWREGKNFGETLVKAATQGTDGLGFCGDLQQAVNRAAEVRDELAPLACCALAASGHAAAPPSSVMKARRFIGLLRPRWRSGSAECSVRVHLRSSD